MLLELVLTTRLLGLVAGDQPIQVQVDSNVRRVDVLVDGERLVKMTSKPFSVVLHFGSEIAPHELTSIAYDAEGNEVGRDTQLVNLARPQAEAEIALDRDARGRLRATVRWQHISAEKPKRIAFTLDGKPLATSSSAVLPEIEDLSLHVLQAQIEFGGGVIATKELVFGGRYSEQMPTELTAVVASENAQCFRSGDRIVRAAAVENPRGDGVLRARHRRHTRAPAPASSRRVQP